MIDDKDIDHICKYFVQELSKISFTYKPKRGLASNPCVGWDQRLLGYRWKSKVDPFHDSILIQKLSDELSLHSIKLVQKKALSKAENERAIENSIKLFTWGGVIRTHANPTIIDINNVMLTAATYKDSFNAPLDSAWTKLAALSSSWNEGQASTPTQIIFDSRVSVSILNGLQRFSSQNDNIRRITDKLKSCGLGYVTGRGGNRDKYVRLLKSAGWKSGYKKWNSQFIASKLAHGMVRALNDSNLSMPSLSGPAKWTTRGVEMVLFMDGY